MGLFQPTAKNTISFSAEHGQDHLECEQVLWSWWKSGGVSCPAVKTDALSERDFSCFVVGCFYIGFANSYWPYEHVFATSIKGHGVYLLMLHIFPRVETRFHNKQEIFSSNYRLVRLAFYWNFYFSYSLENLSWCSARAIDLVGMNNVHTSPDSDQNNKGCILTGFMELVTVYAFSNGSWEISFRCDPCNSEKYNFRKIRRTLFSRCFDSRDKRMSLVANIWRRNSCGMMLIGCCCHGFL